MKGIRFIEMGWRNFLSYGNNLTTISFDFSKPTMICGKNLDDSVDGHIDSNGAGKSTILNALAFVLYDETISGGTKAEGIKKDKLINWINEKNMEVFVKFEKNDIFYKIERFRKHAKKGGDGIRIYSNLTGIFKDDDKDIAENSIAAANKQIERIIGMPFDVFVRVVLLSSSSKSFFLLPAAAAKEFSQRDFLEELFGYTEISEKAEVLKKKTNADKTEFERLSELNQQIIDETKRLTSQIVFAEEQSAKWKEEHDSEITALEKLIESVSEINFEEERIIFEQIAKLESKIQERLLIVREKELIINAAVQAKKRHADWEAKKVSDIDSLKKNIKRYADINFEEQVELHKIISEKEKEESLLEREEYDYEKAIRDAQNIIKSKSDELNHLSANKCPYCKQTFVDAANKINELKTLIENTTIKLNELNVVTKDCSSKLAAVTAFIKEKKAKTIFSTLNDAMSKKIEAESLIRKLADREAEINPHILNEIKEDDEIIKIKDSILELRAKIDKFKCVQKFQNERDLIKAQASLESNKSNINILKNKENPHTATINKLKKTELPENKSEQLEKLKDDIEHQDFLYKLLTNKNSYIRKALLNKNLPLLNSRLRHYLLKVGLPHKVMFTENMTAEISKFGVQIDYGNFSKGQKGRLDLALSFAFRDVLQTRHEKIHLCMLDEYLDNGLSAAGVSMAVKALKEIAREEKFPMFIISHKEEVAAMLDSKVEIELYKKFSNIVRADIPYTSVE